jgi:hypothetical protein
MLRLGGGAPVAAVYPPPISTTSLDDEAMRGSLRTARAMLVSAPVGTRVIVRGGAGQDRVDDERSTACGSASTAPGDYPDRRGPIRRGSNPFTSAARTSGR